MSRVIKMGWGVGMGGVGRSGFHNSVIDITTLSRDAFNQALWLNLRPSAAENKSRLTDVAAFCAGNGLLMAFVDISKMIRHVQQS